MGENALAHMMQFKIPSPPLLRMMGFAFCVNKLMFFWYYFSRHHNDEWILCLEQMIFALW
jgi:hypothetical protein